MEEKTLIGALLFILFFSPLFLARAEGAATSGMLTCPHRSAAL